MITISHMTHPLWDLHFIEWLKWRLAYTGGKRFLTTYLQRLSKRETDEDFEARLALSYCPAFSKVGINEIRDSIYNRMVDITREGGSKSYQTSIDGNEGGVDLLGSSMNYFLGVKVLPELLVMGRCGIYVDMPPLPTNGNLDSARGRKPYIYVFSVEDIRNWVFDESHQPNEFSSILLQENVMLHDKETGFPLDNEVRYRRLWRNNDGMINAAYYKEGSNDMMDQYGNTILDPLVLNVNKIPFIILDIGESMMTDIADYQIALMNLASSDMSYAIRANIPLYTEQFEARAENNNGRPSDKGGSVGDPNAAKVNEIAIGAGKGRRYGKGLERPGFINPSSEPLKASMEKQSQLKEEIRLLLKLALTNIKPAKMASAESKQHDTRSVENGLGYIGLVLENAERKIAHFWDMYERKNSVATIHYPDDYKLLTEDERRLETEYLEGVKKEVPSKTFQKAVQKRQAKIALSSKITSEELAIIDNEIDMAPAMVSDPEVILAASEAGLVGNELASKLLGFPPGEVEKAKVDHTDRLARIAIAQSEGAAAGAAVGGKERGVPDTGADPKAGKVEKKNSRDTTKEPIVEDKTRGKGK